MKELLEFLHITSFFELNLLILSTFTVIYILAKAFTDKRVLGLFYKFEQDDSKEKSDSPIERY